MKKVIFVAGPPGSGKTEFIKKYKFNNCKVFDLDNYRSLSQYAYNCDPLNYSENTTYNAGQLMNQDINENLLNDLPIVIETTFSSKNNTFEQIKDDNRYDISVYLFIVNKIEAFLSVLERCIVDYINGKTCRLIRFEKFIDKINFYETYIDNIKKYNINIHYVVRNGDSVSILNEFTSLNIQYDINDYEDRINNIRCFCNLNNIHDIELELDKLINYYCDYKIKRRKIL